MSPAPHGIDKRIAVLGAGSMGSAIAEGLLAAGWDVVVWNRTTQRVVPLTALGARTASSAASALKMTKLAIVALPDADSVRDILLAEDCKAALPDSALLNVSYTTPDEIVALAEDVSRHGGTLSEVNVTVYPDPVRHRQGHFNVAATAENRDTWLRVLGDLGDHVHDVGEVGNASKAELALWLSFMLTPVAIAYSTRAFEQMNLPHDALMSALTENPTLRLAGAEDLIPQILQATYRTDTYSIDNFLLSMGVVVDEAARLGLPTELFAPVRDLFERAQQQGRGDQDISAVAESIRPTSPSTAPPANHN